MPLPLLASLIPMAAQLGGSIQRGILARRQRRFADQLVGQYPQPQYDRQPEVMQALADAQMAYRSPQSRQAFRQAQQDIEGNVAQSTNLALNSGMGPAELAALISSISQGGQAATRGVYGDASREQTYRLDALNRARMAAAEEGRREFEYNEFQPYMQAMQSAAGLYGASEQNKAGVFRDLATIGGGLAAMAQNAELWAKEKNRGPAYKGPKPRTSGLTYKDTAKIRSNVLKTLKYK